MSLTLELCIRLLGASLLGAAVGYERELRSKGAGVRTHVLVALGSCLFMIISQYGFGTAPKFDAARVAAGVVTGIGFLGGGLIIKKTYVSGLTTAAGLWVTGAMGMGVGCGLYILAGLSVVILLFCMEALSLYDFKYGVREVDCTFTSSDKMALSGVIDSLGKEVKHYALEKQGDVYKADVSLFVPKREKNADLLKRLSAFESVELVSFE